MKTATRWALWAAGVLGVLCAVALVVWEVAGPRIQYARRYSLLKAMIESPDPAERCRGAWRSIDRSHPLITTAMIQGLMGEEQNADVREAYAYSLGRSGEPEGWPGIAYAIDMDSAGAVRAQAWLAAARIDPTRFLELAKGESGPADDWQTLGMAQGRLWLGDVSGVPELLRLAQRGEDKQRYLASQILYKCLRPLLDAVGRWPIEPPIKEGQDWTAEFAAEVERRCHGLDLARISSDTKHALAGMEEVRRTVRRITSARQHLVRWLYGEES